MTPNKQVEFIERVSKSILGLEGLQIVVYSDRTRGELLSKKERESYTFLDIGKKLLQQVDGQYIEEKYGAIEGIEFGKKMKEERIRIIKEMERKESV